MIKKLLVVSAIIEGLTGIVALAAPGFLVSILLGRAMDTAAGLAAARVAGAALVSLAVACWLGSSDAESRAARGIVIGMLVYNISAGALFLYFRFGADMTGVGLLPATAVHATMAIWCIVCLVNPKRREQ